jgi:hypothetical protein
MDRVTRQDKREKIPPADVVLPCTIPAQRLCIITIIIIIIIIMYYTAHYVVI